jgi:hypothetical protein
MTLMRLNAVNRQFVVRVISREQEEDDVIITLGSGRVSGLGAG